VLYKVFYTKNEQKSNTFTHHNPYFLKLVEFKFTNWNLLFQVSTFSNKLQINYLNISTNYLKQTIKINLFHQTFYKV